MELLHAALVVLANGLLEVGTFLFREAAPLAGGILAIALTRIEIREQTEIGRGIETDELLA